MLDHDEIQATLTHKIGLELTELKIEPLLGDASNRNYHRLHLNGSGVPASLILMELADPEGFKKAEEKVTRSELPITELPFINILNHLARAGVAVPKLYHYRKESGWLFLQDLGDETMDKRVTNHDWEVNQGSYRMALDELVKIQFDATRHRSSECIAFGRPFDSPLLMWEFDHFLEYGVPYCGTAPFKSNDREELRVEFQKISDELANQPRVFTHRDYHSRNLIFHDDRVWVLDFQDALMGPHVYDLASLLRDSYQALESDWVEDSIHYYWERMKTELGSIYTIEKFRRLFDFMSIQRNLKAIGRFVYIDKVKKNPRFLPYIQKTLSYVRSNLDRYKELKDLRRLLLPYLEGPRVS